MDVSVNPVLESVRPFFQGLPANNASSPTTNPPSHPGAATPVQPSQHGFQQPSGNTPSSSPSSVLSYWPQRPKEPAKSPALASPLHHVYNGTKLGEPLQPTAQQPELQRHNLPPIAAAYQYSRTVLRQPQHHQTLPSITQITAKVSSESHAQFRAPEYPQSNHHSIYSPNSSSNQSHSRSSSSSSYQSHQQMLANKYQSSSGSSPSPYSYSSHANTSSPAYSQTTSTTSAYVSSSQHHQLQSQMAQLQRTQQSRPPSNQPTHHPMSPVIQQPNHPDLHGHLKLHHQSSLQQPMSHQPPNHQLPSHQSSSHQSSSHQSSSHQSSSHQSSSHQSSSHQPTSHQTSSHQTTSHQQQFSSSHHQQPHSPYSHTPSVSHHNQQQTSPHPSAQLPQQQKPTFPQQSSNHQHQTHQQHSSSHLSSQPTSQSQRINLHSSHPQQNSSHLTHFQQSSSHSTHPQQSSSHLSRTQQSSLHPSHPHPSHSQQQPSHPSVVQHSSQSQTQPSHSQHAQAGRHQQQQQQHYNQQTHKSSAHPQQGQHQQSSSQHLLSQQQHQLQQQAALYNQTVQQSSRQSDAEMVAEMQQMLRIKERQLAAAQAQQQAYYAAASSSSSTRSSSQVTTKEASNQQQTITTQALAGKVRRESPLDLSVKTVRQSADSTAKDDSESLYLSSIKHEYQHRTQVPVKTASPRGSATLPLQLPSTVVHPLLEHNTPKHPSSQSASSGVPKVDFLPNFQAHGATTGSSSSFQDPSKRQRKTSTSQPSQSPYPPSVGSLPHMGSFKKSSLLSAAYNDPNKQSQYYPATGPPTGHRSSALANHSSLNMQPNFAGAPGSHYPFDTSKRESSARYDLLERRNSLSSMQSASQSEYSLGKRHSSSDLKHPLPPKFPKGVDTWRQTIDQQIEQRLNSYVSAQGHQINGRTKESNNDLTLHQQAFPPFSCASPLSIQTSQNSNTVLSSSRSLHSSQSNSSSKLNLTSQHYSHSQHPYQSHSIPQRTLQEPYNNPSKVKLPNLPSNGAADKRVLSILRKRLDTREATNQLLQQQSQASLHHDRSKMYSSLGSRYYPQPMIAPSPVIASEIKPPTPTPIARHNLPPFNALNMDRNPATPYSTQKLHIPKAMDSVLPEYTQGHLYSRADLVPRSPSSSRTEVNCKSGSGEGGADFDGLAALFAARIRTKAELKQVGPSVEQQRTSTPASGSNSSAHSPRTTPGIFSPPPSSVINYPAVPGDHGKGTPASESDRASSSGYSNSSPTKSFRDRYGVNSPRRKLFGRPEDEQEGVSEGVIRAREGGLRSSSETSVFDFRESDSDGETVSERQSLHEMRKDRDRRLQEKHQNEPACTLDPTSDLIEINDSEPIEDSFWSGMCDQFVHQLQKGGIKVRKRGRRKKWQYIPIELVEPDTDSESEIKPGVPCTKVVSQEIVKEGESNLVSEDKKDITTESKPSISLFEKDKIIKTEKVEDDKSYETVKHEVKPLQSEENTFLLKNSIKKEEESSDEDLPLSLRQNEFKKVKDVSTKNETSICEDKYLLETSHCIKPFVKLEKLKKEDLKNDHNLEQKISKSELSDTDDESSADETVDPVAKRLRMRKPREDTVKTKRKTRSSEKENSVSPKKVGRKKKEEKKKSVYGDGSEFKPGWEAEVYRYKRSLRMPARLINIAGPQSWPRLSVSLPDLDPDSPMTLDQDISLENKKFDSDNESTPTKNKSKDFSKSKSQKKPDDKPGKTEEDSFINRLVQRYGGKGKKTLRKVQEKDRSKERKGPKVIPQSNELQLLPTPSLDCIVKTPLKKTDQAVSQSKPGRGRRKNKFEEKPIDFENKETVYLGYFRKKTVADFRDAFAKHNGGFATEHELPPIMLKSRTRTQTRILTQRATIREVFGEDRPASAPPAGCREDENNENQNDLDRRKKSKKFGKKSKTILNKLNSCGIPGTRSGLRSAAVLRSNKAVFKSKQHLLHGGERRKRDKDLIKSFKSIKQHKKGQTDKENGSVEDKLELEEELMKLESEDVPGVVCGKRLKYKSIRRKPKSSGFDYIRKKKKQQQKKDGDNESVKEKKKVMLQKPVLESEEDIQNEIKGWVINKGLGETVLHRAARLGYTDIAAYCLEKMDHNPSPRDNAGYTPLHEACSKGRLDIARLLLQYGADVSDSAKGGIRPLHEAAESGSLEMMRLLLSYGADPLLATYSGHTPLSLTYNSLEARALLQNHLADVQGLPSEKWNIQHNNGVLSGNDPLSDAPAPDLADFDIEIESAELSLPHLYQLLGEPITDRWVLFQELGPVLRVKTRDALIKQLGPSHRNDFRDLKMTEFYDMARCCSILGAGDYILNPKAHKVTLVKYSDRVRELLNCEKTVIPAR